MHLITFVTELARQKNESKPLTKPQNTSWRASTEESLNIHRWRRGRDTRSIAGALPLRDHKAVTLNQYLTFKSLPYSSAATSSAKNSIDELNYVLCSALLHFTSSVR
ncbi:hypothetical protein CDAR_496081 [Caerostris darwini]|uniref:Uncharacterized protein n=1 Tax=Caerostris darwini TaxID=1538125 RepID=A0AAV4U1R2_9ARAC|nr:hypothetical protein CDAR_496081 [Caerostris darwini]